jgi:hypothetical protein
LTRDELIAIVADFAGPVGPLREPEDQERAFYARLAAATAEDLETLAGLIGSPGEVPGPDGDESWAHALEEALVTVGARHVALAMDRVTTRLVPGAAGRGIAIAVIGRLRAPASLAALRDLVDDASLTDPEIEELAGAVQQVGGPEAVAVLRTMQERFGDRPARREIDMCLDLARAGVRF